MKIEGVNIEDYTDLELKRFEANGAASLPIPTESGYASHEGAKIWYSSFGAGRPVLLLHGGFGHSGKPQRHLPVPSF